MYPFCPHSHTATALPLRTLRKGGSCYHLKRHRYPNKISKIVSITATTAIGKNNPAITPMQNAIAVSPAALAQPLMQTLIITISIPPPKQHKFNVKLNIYVGLYAVL